MKVILFIILLTAVALVSIKITSIDFLMGKPSFMAYPLESFDYTLRYCAPCNPEIELCPVGCFGYELVGINYINLLADILFWYLISCVLILIYKKVVKK